MDKYFNLVMDISNDQKGSVIFLLKAAWYEGQTTLNDNYILIWTSLVITIISVRQVWGGFDERMKNKRHYNRNSISMIGYS